MLDGLIESTSRVCAPSQVTPARLRLFRQWSSLPHFAASCRMSSRAEEDALTGTASGSHLHEGAPEASAPAGNLQHAGQQGPPADGGGASGLQELAEWGWDFSDVHETAQAECSKRSRHSDDRQVAGTGGTEALGGSGNGHPGEACQTQQLLQPLQQQVQDGDGGAVPSCCAGAEAAGRAGAREGAEGAADGPCMSLGLGPMKSARHEGRTGPGGGAGHASVGGDGDGVGGVGAGSGGGVEQLISLLKQHPDHEVALAAALSAVQVGA